MSDLRVGETVELTIEAEVIARYESGRVKIRWDSGEEVIYPSDMRLKNE